MYAVEDLGPISHRTPTIALNDGMKYKKVIRFEIPFWGPLLSYV